MGDIKKIFINGKQHYKWMFSEHANKEDITIFLDLLSHFKTHPHWNGEITVDNNNNNNNNNKSVTLVAKSIMYLPDFLKKEVMDYELVEELILYLGLQMLVLHKYKKGVLFFNLNDIIVIDSKLFFLGNLQHVLEVNDGEQLVLSYPMNFTKEDERFLPPEILHGKKVLPFITCISAGYYSLAKLCIYCLGLDDINDNHFTSLGPIMGSKMYFFLERCLFKDPGKRSFLYI